MATKYYGVAFGGDRPIDVTKAGSTTSSNVEVSVVYDASQNSKLATLKALKAIHQRIFMGKWPPA